MPDLSDISSYFAAQAALAVYPNGIGNPSVANLDVHVFEGWPNAAQLDLDVQGLIIGPNGIPISRPGGKAADVSVYPMAGASAAPYQIQDQVYVIFPPVFGMSVTVAGPVITVAGQPNPGEYLTIIADRQFIFSATGASTAAILAALAAQASVNYGGVSNTSTTLTIPYNYAFTVRIGGIGTLGKATHRQRHAFMITTWAPDHTSRATIAAAIDNLLKRTITTTLPVDNSMIRIVYSRTTETDEQQTAIIYRRDLIFDVDYATVYEFPGYAVTSISTDVAGGNWALNPAPNPLVIPALAPQNDFWAAPVAAATALSPTTPTRAP